MRENKFLLQPEKMYGRGTKIEKNTGLYTEFKVDTKYGTAKATRYAVMPGIELYYNNFHISKGLDYSGFTTDDRNILVINHCHSGKFEFEFDNGEFTYLSAGDLAVNSFAFYNTRARCPMLQYSGISIIIDMDIVPNVLNELEKLLQMTVVDINALQQRLCPESSCFIIRSTPALSHIFDELYSVQDIVKQKYFSLKILELLLFLDTAKPNNEKRIYFRRKQVEAIKAIEKYITKDLRRQVTLIELSEKFTISLTTMKICFKEVYGTSIYQYIKAYRINAAATVLRDTSKSIEDISFEVGYESPSKFTAAFRSIMNITPTEYRKKTLSEWDN